MPTTVILLPFFFAFLAFALRFYSREGAASMGNLSFILAVVTLLVAGFYLFLGVIAMMPAYGTIAFALIGLALFGVGIARWFRI